MAKYIVDEVVLSWVGDALADRIREKKEDVAYERARGTAEGLEDEQESLAELERDLRAATAASKGGEAVEVRDAECPCCGQALQRTDCLCDAEVE